MATLKRTSALSEEIAAFVESGLFLVPLAFLLLMSIKQEKVRRLKVTPRTRHRLKRHSTGLLCQPRPANPKVLRLPFPQPYLIVLVYRPEELRE